MKSISNELDIIIHVIASQLSGHCVVISHRLWRHQQNENRVSDTGMMRKDCRLYRHFCIHYAVCKKQKMYVLSRRTVSVLTRVLFWCLPPPPPPPPPPRCFATREINTKITLSSALKQFVTWVHTLFFMSPLLWKTWIFIKVHTYWTPRNCASGSRFHVFHVVW